MTGRSQDATISLRSYPWLSGAAVRHAGRASSVDLGKLPDRVSDYRVESALGSGATGEVLLATHPIHGRVALKLLTKIDHRTLERFQREGAVLQQLSHPNIVEVYEIGSGGGFPFIAMRHVDGPSLASAGKLPFADAAELAQDLCAALEHAHRHGLVHRDVKPSNVLVDAARGAQLVDFGLIRDTTAVDEGLTATGEILGTPGFMAPEQADGAGASASALADQFAVGATLYFLLTQKVPFEAKSLSHSLVMTAMGDFPRPSEHNPSIPLELEAIVLRAMATDPRKRFASCAQMAQDLERFRRGEEVQSLYVVFSDAVHADRVAGWRVRRRVLVYGGPCAMDRLSLPRVARYEPVGVHSHADAVQELSDASFGAVVVDAGAHKALDVLEAAGRHQSDAARFLACRTPPSLHELGRIVGEIGVDAVVDLGAPGDPMGAALDRAFLRPSASVDLRDEVRRLRRQIAALTESIEAISGDLQTRTRAVSELEAKLRRTRTAFTNLSVELRERELELKDLRSVADREHPQATTGRTP